jgi:phage terminase large subunit-like protein
VSTISELPFSAHLIASLTPEQRQAVVEEMNHEQLKEFQRGWYHWARDEAGAFLEQIVKKYEGTRLGRQELNAELLDDVPGALWTRALIEAARPPMGFVLPDLVRVVVAIDPAASSGEDADETGIIVAGRDKDSRGYVLADLSGHYTPIEWARIACTAYHAHSADRIVAEINNGGEMVENTIRVVDDNVAYTGVHASRGKVVRAEPVSALYEYTLTRCALSRRTLTGFGQATRRTP